MTRAIVGHSTAQMPHHYSHVDEGEKRAAAALVLDVATGGKGVAAGVAAGSASSASETPKAGNPAGSRGF